MDTDAIYSAVCAYGAAKCGGYTFDAHDHIEAVKRLLNEAEAEHKSVLDENERLVDEVQAARQEISEMVQKLTKKAELLRGCYARINGLEKALSFYADPIRYQGPNQMAEPGDKWTPEDAPYRQDVSRDNGSIARAALEKKHER